MDTAKDQHVNTEDITHLLENPLWSVELPWGQQIFPKQLQANGRLQARGGLRGEGSLEELPWGPHGFSQQLQEEGRVQANEEGRGDVQRDGSLAWEDQDLLELLERDSSEVEPADVPKIHEEIEHLFEEAALTEAEAAHSICVRVCEEPLQPHFGPITAAYHKFRRRGINVGDTFRSRKECREWGVHLPPVAGIAGNSQHGAQSVCVSGGYKDDSDHGDWLVYTGSGGREYTRETSTYSHLQSKDQTFTKLNESLRVSCQQGLPVRVIRKLTNPKSALEEGQIGRLYRYDGIYRALKCWRIGDTKGPLMCRFLMVRCDNEPSPWKSEWEIVADERPGKTFLELVEKAEKTLSLEIQKASDLFTVTEPPFWDWRDELGWGWVKTPPILPSKKRKAEATTTIIAS